MEENNVKFIAPSSRFHPGFWEELYNNALNKYNNPSFTMQTRASTTEGTILDKLPMLQVPISCSLGKNDRSCNECFEFSATSFVDESKNIDNFSYKGFLYVTNTIEEFRDMDKQLILQTIGKESVYKNIVSGEAIVWPELLNCFVLLVYCDLKQYKFTYWLGVPAILPSFPFTLVEQGLYSCATCSESPTLPSVFLPLQDLVQESEKEKFECSDTSSSEISGNKSRDNADEMDRREWFDPMKLDSNHTEIIEVDNIGQRMVLQIYHHLIAVQTAVQSIFALRIDNSQLRMLSLQEAWSERFDPNTFFVCVDMSSTPSAFGWNIRNFLSLLAAHPNSETGFQSVRIIGLRGKLAQKLLNGIGRRSSGSLPTSKNTVDSLGSLDDKYILSEDRSIVVNIDINRAAFPDNSSLRIVGWETNERLKPGPRVADLSSVLSSEVLMAQAVDLNLRLMKWRMWTDLDLEKLKRTRCLLIGAGTLGCAVARTLLGWGVTDLTLVDSGVVSFSNPTRQCLFEFADCERREKKSVAAANALRRIFPGVQARGVVLTVPMPGHMYSSNDKDCSLESAFNELEELIKNSDVVFTLTDSREARWLPTVLCAVWNVQLINAALGFDSYLVMRQGNHNKVPSDGSLGCYFCNDIVAAGNSQRDRTMDQQCTVTRPGLAFVAASLAAEMMVALSQARDADVVIPHQIRGNFRDFSQMHLQSPAFSCCTACSPAIINEFKTDFYEGRSLIPSSQTHSTRVEFLRQVCENSKILEVVSGVAQLTADVNLDLCVESDEEF